MSHNLLPSPRTIRVTDPDFDAKGYGTKFGRYLKPFLQRHYVEPAEAIDQAQEAQTFAQLPTRSEATFKGLPKAVASWNNPLQYLTFAAFITTVHSTIVRTGAKNFIHPVFHRIAQPVAWAALAFGGWNAYNLTKKAHYDDRTAEYQAAANITWNVTNNVLFPVALFKFLHSRRQQIPLAAAVSVAVPLLMSTYTRFNIEGMFLRRRFKRKDYGSHGQSYETTTFAYDTPLDQWEQIYNDEGNEHIIHRENESLYAHVFPMFSMAEALPTHEVPMNSIYYENPEVVPVQSSILQGTIELQKRSVPTPSSITADKFSSRFWGEWSMATPSQAAMDLQLFQHPRGRAALGALFKQYSSEQLDLQRSSPTTIMAKYLQSARGTKELPQIAKAFETTIPEFAAKFEQIPELKASSWLLQDELVQNATQNTYLAAFGDYLAQKTRVSKEAHLNTLKRGGQAPVYNVDFEALDFQAKSLAMPVDVPRYSRASSHWVQGDHDAPNKHPMKADKFLEIISSRLPIEAPTPVVEPTTQ